MHNGNRGASHSCETLKLIVDSGETAEDDLRPKNKYKTCGKTFGF